MLRWTILRQIARKAARAQLPFLLCSRGSGSLNLGSATRWATTTTKGQDEGSASLLADDGVGPRTPWNTLRPERRKCDEQQILNERLAVLEPTLPPHLQQSGTQPGPALTPNEIVQVLTSVKSIVEQLSGKWADPLSYIACETGRWGVTAWLMKHLLESFATPIADQDTPKGSLCTWRNDTLLNELTSTPVDVQHPTFLRHQPSGAQEDVSLDVATSNYLQGVDVQSVELRHRALGMIWRGLGNIVINCVEGEIKPEILEIIAMMHQHGAMPSSIYDTKPSQDPTAIQRSPILNLLSSRILTSLSDAAWRAHEERLAGHSGNDEDGHALMRHKTPGAAVRARNAGVKPEVWLELILCSCLHGGWILDGMDLLNRMNDAQKPHAWRPLSWRVLIWSQPSGARDWERMEFLFNNSSYSSLDAPKLRNLPSVTRTISSELVNAFVDAGLSVTSVSGDHHLPSLEHMIQFAIRMQDFLRRASLSLNAGSWDAIILRLIDLHDDKAFEPSMFSRIIHLSPRMGQETAARNVRDLPEYVFDGTAATFGLFHRALHRRINNADVEGALRLFTSLQTRADENKRRSVADFLRKRKSFATAEGAEKTGHFTHNYGSIDYPAFYVQIPPTILGPFLELVTDAKAYEFGKWLLYSDDLDGPIIPENIYGDAALLPALIRFASETRDQNLLARLVELRGKEGAGDRPTLSKHVLQSFFESQVNLHQWDAATKILQHLKATYGFDWNIVTLCHLLRVVLLQDRKARAGDQNARRNQARARGLFQELVRGEYDRVGERPDYVQEQVDNLLLVLASVGGQWARLSMETQEVEGYRVFNVPSKAFNLVLEGVVDAYGSSAGRRLIGIYWSHVVRNAQEKQNQSDRQATAPPFSSFGRPLPETIRRQRTEIYLPGSQRKVIVYGGLRPDLMTIRIIMREAIEELLKAPDVDAGVLISESAAAIHTEQSRIEAEEDELNDESDPKIDHSPLGMVVWAAKCLKRLGMTVEDLDLELRLNLPKSKVDQVIAKAPTLLADEDDLSEKSPEAAADTSWAFKPFTT